MSTYKDLVREALTAAKEAKSTALADLDTCRVVTFDDINSAIYYLRKALDRAPTTKESKEA